MLDGDLGLAMLAHKRRRREGREVRQPDRNGHGRNRLRVALFQGNRARNAEGLLGQRRGDVPRDLLESSVLQQLGEKEVAPFEELQVLFLLAVARQQARGLHLEQRRRDDEEFGDLRKVELRARADEGDEFVGDLGQSHLCDVEALARNEGKQNGKRAGEDVELNGEFPVFAGFGGVGRRGVRDAVG